MAESTSTASKQPSGWTGFFGSVVGTLGDTVKEVLPNWTKQQLLEQEVDQLEQQTFDEKTAPSRVDTIQKPEPGPVAAMSQTAFSLGNFNVSYLMLAGGFAGILAVGLFLRMR